MPPPLKRCAVYTRKSSEEGLEQDFNSLHAQREACEAFIRSQKSEGWKLLPEPYDDGGLSGGTLERPALQRLLADIDSRKVDIVVVYKVDRLTRSLADFAKMVELFDARGVSFVAVTQQFNTTSSMGRLTLNILLSFAQFEREVTGERIRDKIAASKKKGIWMGGNVPLGYEVKERKLLIVAAEAERVRHIYRRYLELGSVRDLARDLKHNGIRSKSGGIISRGALYALLSNPIYIGEIRHKDLRHPGQHEPILDRGLWENVQQQLAANGVERTERKRLTDPSPLAGKLFDATGQRLTPSYAVKQGRRYRYYVSQSLVTGSDDASQGWRLPAPDLERAVAQALGNILSDRVALSGIFSKAGIAPSYLAACLTGAKERMQRSDLIALAQRVEVSEQSLTLTVPLAGLVPKEAEIADPESLTLTRTIPMRSKKRGIEMRLIIAGDTTPSKADPTLLKTIARAHRWWSELSSGAMPTVASIAKREGVSDGHIGHHLPLAFLAPDIVQAIVTGNQPPDLTAETLIKRIDLPLDWAVQKALLGIS